MPEPKFIVVANRLSDNSFTFDVVAVDDDGGVIVIQYCYTDQHAERLCSALNAAVRQHAE